MNDKFKIEYKTPELKLGEITDLFIATAWKSEDYM